MVHNTKERKIEVGDVVLIKDEEIVKEFFKVKEDVICVVKLRTPKSHIERLIQYLYLLELHCNIKKINK